MLRKPGSSTGPRPSRSRKTAAETPEETLRKIQRKPGNKKCADCTSKLPQVVNLSFGTFICLACAGVHREFSHRVKGIGHSTFTPEEIIKLQSPSSGNEAVNSFYMALYDPNSVRERLRPPRDNNDLQLLRVWIRRKYIDKAWYQKNDDLGEQDEIVNNEKSDKSDKNNRAEKKKSNSGKTNTKSGILQPTVVSIPPTKTSANTPALDLFGGWDTPSAESKPAHDPFSSNVDSHTTVQTNDPFVTDFYSQKNLQQNDPFVADFDNQSSNQTQDPFNSGSNLQESKPTLSEDPFSQANEPQQSIPFQADFNQMESSNNTALSNTEAIQDFAFTADFSESEKTLNSAENANAQQTSLPQFEQSKKLPSTLEQTQNHDFKADFHVSKTSINSAENDFVQQSSLTNPEQSVFEPSFDNMQSSTQPSQTRSFGNFQENHEETQENTLPSSGETKGDDPFDAFSHLEVPRRSEPSEKQKETQNSGTNVKSNYVEGQSLFYKEKDGGMSEVTILKIHLDEELVPYYTIKFSSGREKQTDDAHLTPYQVEERSTVNENLNQTNLPQSSANVDAKSFDNTPDHSQFQMAQHMGMNQLTEMIQTLSFQQLLMVQQVITTRMQSIQMEQHSQMMAMSPGNQNGTGSNNTFTSANPIQNQSLPQTTSAPQPLPNSHPPPPPIHDTKTNLSNPLPSSLPEGIPPPPLEIPPPPPPQPSLKGVANIEKKGNPFDSF